MKQLSSAGSNRVDFCGFGLNPINQGAFSVFPPHLVYERSREVIGHLIFIDLQFSRKILGQQVHCARGAALLLGFGALLGSFII